MWGLRERLDTLETGYGTLLLPGIRAEILGLLDRLDLVCGELKEVEAEKAARLTASKATLKAHGATAAVPLDPEAGEDRFGFGRTCGFGPEACPLCGDSWSGCTGSASMTRCF